MDYEGIPGAEPGAVPERPRQSRARATKGLFSPDWARGRSGLPPQHLQGDLEQGIRRGCRPAIRAKGRRS